MSTLLSVILCTHNPKAEVFERTLAALRDQRLDPQLWELIVIDSGSTPAVGSLAGAMSNWRIVREDEPGLTRARLKGFEEAKGAIIVLVDDDNVLDADYLGNGLRLFCEDDGLGVAGASICGEYEMELPRWLERELVYLAIRSVEEVSVDDVDSLVVTPAGAGMILRARVARHYGALVNEHTMRKQLDRSGSSLVSAGDTDLALCARDLGLKIGHFPCLKLIHLIGKGRMSVEYMERLHEGLAYSGTILSFIRSSRIPDVRKNWLLRLRAWIRYFIRLDSYQRCFHQAQLRGVQRAQLEIKKFRANQ